MNERKRGKLQPPKTAAVDVGSSVLRVGASFVPVLGGAISEAIGLAAQQLANKRTEKFYQDVADRLLELQDQIDALTESFVSRALEAARIVEHTGEEDKLEALRNAVVNTLSSTAPSEDIQHLFLNYVDQLSGLHLRLLTFVIEPEKFGVSKEDADVLHGINPRDPGLTNRVLRTVVAPGVRDDVLQTFWNTLANYGLVAYNDEYPPLPGPRIPWATAIGDEFYTFISRRGSQGLHPNDEMR